MEKQDLPPVREWFYESSGQRKGPLSENEIVGLIKSGSLSHGSSVWKKGFPDWMKVENTQLREHLDEVAPPPLTGEHVNNTVVWVLAFAPILGLILEFIVAMMVTGSEHRAERAVLRGEFFYVTPLLNVALAYWDEKRLKASGTDTGKFNGMVWLVPVYLFQRAKALRQGNGYFIVWIACLVLVVLSTAIA